MIALGRIGVALLVGVSTAWGWQQKLPVGAPDATAIMTPSGDVAVARCVAIGDPSRSRLVIAMLRGSTGVQRWQTNIPHADFCWPPHMIADDAGDLFLAINLVRFNPTHLNPTHRVVVKLAGSDGRELWRDERNPGYPHGFVRRPDGSIVVSDPDVITALDAETGTTLWSIHTEGFLSLLASDAGGDLFAVLTRNAYPDPGDIIVVKVDGASGSELWRRVFDGTIEGGGSWDVATDLAVDDAGDVVVTGFLTNAHPHASGALGDEDALVAKLAGASGEEQWRTLLVGMKGGDDRPGQVAIASGGDAVVSVQLDGRPQVMRLLGGSGEVTWHTVWGTGADGDPEEFVQSIAIDAGGDVLELGTYASNRVAVAKLAGATGNEQWLQTFIAKRPGEDVTLDGQALALGLHGDIALTGTSVRFTAGGTLGATTATKLSSTVAGKRLVIRDDGAVRKVTLVMRDPYITPALADGPGDPSVAGASLALSSASGDRIVLALPAGGWAKRVGGGFEYRGSGGAQTCPEVVLAPGSLTARCRTNDAGLSPLGSVDVTFTLGEPGFPYCASFGGAVKQDRPVSADAPGLFRAIDAPPPASCG